MLVNCPECNREVSDFARTCPHCGFPLETSRKAARRRERTTRASVDPGKAFEDVISAVKSLFGNAATLHLWDLPGEGYVSRSLPMKWYKFWTYFSLPFGSVLGLIMGIPLESAPLILIAALQLFAAWQLHLKTYIGFVLNSVIIVMLGIVGIVPWNAPSTADVVAKSIIGLVFFGLLWFWPNYRYWKRREHLFVSRDQARQNPQQALGLFSRLLEQANLSPRDGEAGRANPQEGTRASAVILAWKQIGAVIFVLCILAAVANGQLSLAALITMVGALAIGLIYGREMWIYASEHPNRSGRIIGKCGAALAMTSLILAFFIMLTII